MSCSQLIEIEDLVLGTIEPARARELRVHVGTCTACRHEQAAVIKERALFTHREAILDVPSEAVAVALRAQLTAELVGRAAAPANSASRMGRRAGPHADVPSLRSIGPARQGATFPWRPSAPSTRFVRRGAAALGRVLRRGHVSAACAAVLFALVAFSKLGGAPVLPAAEPDGASREAANGPAASLFSQSLADETLACSASGSMTTFSNDTLVSSGATTQSSSSGATLREVLACGRGGEGSGASCEPSVTCSSLRQ